ncbi:hypothetical protein EMCRGX_G028224 [Ephydatia muelleri]
MANAPHDRFHPYVLPHSDRPSTSRINDHVPAPAVRGNIHPPASAPVAPALAPVQRPAAAAPHHPLQASLDKIIAGINEISLTLVTIQLEQQTQASQLNDLMQSSFSIEKSGYKGITVKVLKRDASKKYRKDAASVFIKARLGELRAEERRRVLGQKPCDVYLSLACNEFVEKFLPTLKLEREAIPLYPCHVAMLVRAHLANATNVFICMERLVPLQRKYCRSVLNYKEKMHKGFDVWLRQNYPDGKPSGLQLQSALAEDDALFYPPADPIEYQHNSPIYTEMPRAMSQD